VKRVLRSVVMRASAPLVQVLDQRLQALAERLERHTVALSQDHGRRLDRIEERSAVDVRVVNEQLLAMRRIARNLDAGGSAVRDEILTAIGASLAGEDPTVLVAVAPGQPADVPEGYEVARSLAVRLHRTNDWEAADAADDEVSGHVVFLRRRV
jgi:hypothetical protein